MGASPSATVRRHLYPPRAHAILRRAMARCRSAAQVADNSAPRAHAERLWKDHFREPSQFLYNRYRKTNPRAPDCRHRLTNKKTQEEEMNRNESWEMLSLEDALASLEERMLPLPSIQDLACILHMCRKERNLAHALRLHAYMRVNGLEAHTSLGNCLVSMLVEVGSMPHAQQVFDSLEHQDERSWNILITGYVKHGESQHALSLYQKMQEDISLHPSGYTFAALLKACTILKDVERGCQIHAEIARKGLLERDIFIGSTLVDMYAKCGFLAKAQEVFDKLPVRNVVVWTALIAGYNEHGHGEEALNCFEQMQHEGIFLDAVTFICSLKACGNIGATDKLQQIHAGIAKKGLERDLVVGSTLVDTYAKCFLPGEAQKVFDKLPVRDMVSWTALITGYVECGYGEEALDCFEQMQHKGVSPGPVTFLCSLKACGSIGSMHKGHEIHAEIIKKGLERDLFVGSTLVDMYAKRCLLAEAQKVFDKLSIRNMVSWTALIAGYAEHGHGEQALSCFEKMQHEGISPGAATFVCSLKACGSIGATDKGREMHAEIARKGWLGRDVFIGSALVDMYAKCGSLAKAQEVFYNLPIRNVVTWTALTAGYAEHGSAEEAINCYEQMQYEGISPVAATLVCGMKACGSIGTTIKGREIHAEIARKGVERELLVGNALVDMYVKCGSLAEAQEVFEKLLVRDVVSWTALITGYAQLGESENVFHIFGRMIGEGIKPNLITFGSVLNACSHAGLMDKGQMYLEAISNDYGLIPTLEHYTCIVDLLGRAGHVDKAVALIKKMPFHPGIVIWHTVLGACRTWGNVELGWHAFEHAVRLDEKDPAAYICMSNIYADAAMQEDAKKVEAMRMGRQAWMKPGQSWWRDACGILHSFPVGEGHFQNKNFNAKTEDLSLKVGKRELCRHSEKLTLACALNNTPKGTSIYVVKYLRVCKDCHLAMAHISKIEQRKIVVKDADSVHVFEEGGCACGDSW